MFENCSIVQCSNLSGIHGLSRTPAFSHSVHRNAAAIYMHMVDKHQLPVKSIGVLSSRLCVWIMTACPRHKVLNLSHACDYEWMTAWPRGIRGILLIRHVYKLSRDMIQDSVRMHQVLKSSSQPSTHWTSPVEFTTARLKVKPDSQHTSTL